MPSEVHTEVAAPQWYERREAQRVHRNPVLQSLRWPLSGKVVYNRPVDGNSHDTYHLDVTFDANCEPLFDRKYMQQRVDASPFGPWWGLLVESVSTGVASVRLPYRQSLEGMGGVLHGGCTVVVADVAVWVAIMTVVEGGDRALTVHVTTDYIAPAKSDIIGTARLLKVGRRSAVAIVETRTDDGKLVGTHQVTYALPSVKG